MCPNDLDSHLCPSYPSGQLVGLGNGNGNGRRMKRLIGCCFVCSPVFSMYVFCRAAGANESPGLSKPATTLVEERRMGRRHLSQRRVRRVLLCSRRALKLMIRPHDRLATWKRDSIGRIETGARARYNQFPAPPRPANNHHILEHHQSVGLLE